MAKTLTTTNRKLMLSDIQSLVSMLNKAEYNCKVALSMKDRGFRNCDNFKAPKVTEAKNRQYVINNLIELKNMLNEINLGNIIETQEEDFEF